MSEPLTPEQALIRLRQYQERPAPTWSTASYGGSSAESTLAEIGRTLAVEVERLRATGKDTAPSSESTRAEQPLTAEQEHDIRDRVAAATKGPWGAYSFGGDTLIEIAADLEETGTGYRARREICRLEDEPMDNDPAHREWTAEEDWAQVQADAAFTAHARTDVPALLAELDQTRAGARKHGELAARRESELIDLRARVAELEAELRRLRGGTDG